VSQLCLRHKARNAAAGGCKASFKLCVLAFLWTLYSTPSQKRLFIAYHGFDFGYVSRPTANPPQTLSRPTANPPFMKNAYEQCTIIGWLTTSASFFGRNIVVPWRKIRKAEFRAIVLLRKKEKKTPVTQLLPGPVSFEYVLQCVDEKARTQSSGRKYSSKKVSSTVFRKSNSSLRP